MNAKLAKASQGPAEAAPDEANTGNLVPATASRYERSSRSLKHGDTFAVFDHNGDALASPGNPEGIFHRDTRHLSHFALTLNGARPLLLSSTLRDDNATLDCDLTNPALVLDPGGEKLKHDLIHVRRTRFLWQDACYERLMLRNYDEVQRTLKVEIAFAADFADLFEVRGTPGSAAARIILHLSATTGSCWSMTGSTAEPAARPCASTRSRRRSLARRRASSSRSRPTRRNRFSSRSSAMAARRVGTRRPSPSFWRFATPEERCATRPRGPPRSSPPTPCSTRR